MVKRVNKEESKGAQRKKDRYPHIPRDVHKRKAFATTLKINCDRHHKLKLTKLLPSKDLAHIYCDEPSISEFESWAPAHCFNTIVADIARIKCYMCGGRGHFYPTCPYHSAIEKAASGTVLRRAIMGRIVSLVVSEQQ